MSRRPVAVTLLSILIGVLLVMNLNPAWAQMMTIAPDPPIANQSFTISIPAPDTGPVYVENVSGCVGSAVFSAFIGAPSYSVTVPGLPAGQYSFFFGTTTDCEDFNIVPASTSTSYTTYAQSSTATPLVALVTPVVTPPSTVTSTVFVQTTSSGFTTVAIALVIVGILVIVAIFFALKRKPTSRRARSRRK